MKATQHTAGRWEVTNSGGKVTTLVNNEIMVICTLETAPLKITEEIEANAGLIAASPTMLQTLKTFQNYFKSLANKGSLTPAEEGQWKLVDEAIAKATEIV